MIEVRPSRPGDASAILALCEKMHAEARAALPVLPDPDLNMALAAIALSIREQFSFVAIRDGRMIGCIGGFPSQQWWSQQWFINEGYWFVLPKHRKATGAAVSLMQAFLDRTSDCNMPVFIWGLGGIKRGRAVERAARRMGFEVAGLNLIHGA